MDKSQEQILSTLEQLKSSLAERGVDLATDPTYKKLVATIKDTCAKGTCIQQKVDEQLALLRETSRRYALLINEIDDLSIVLLDKDTNVVIWNEGSEAIFHIKAQEAIGESFLKFVPTSGSEKVKLTDVLSQDFTNNRFEWFGSITRQNASPFFVNIVINIIRDDKDGSIINFLVLTRNITAKRFSESKFKSIVESSPDGIILSNHKGIITLVNKKLESLFGYNRDELLGQPLEILIPSDIKHRHVALRDGFLAHPKSRPMGEGKELRAQKKDGSQFFVEISLTPFETEAGLAVGATIRDITERKTWEKQLEASEERLNDAQLYARMGSFEYDVTENKLLVSAGWKRLLGVELDFDANKFLLDNSLFDEFFDLEEFEKFKRDVIKAVDSKKHIKSKLRVTPRGSSDKRTWFITLSPVDLGVGKSKILGVCQDITEQEHIQNELKKATLKAQEAVELKQQFLANMSHEIRTPMNAILGFSRLMLRSNLDQEHQEFVSAIYDSAENLLVVLDDILDFSKMEAGKLNISPVHFSLPDLLQHLYRLFKLRSEENGILFTLKIDDDIAPVLIGDRYRINQILINLVTNAIKFTKKGSVELGLSLKAADNTTQTIEIRVKDTGIGIPKDKQESIFESFRQAEGDTTRKFGGTGLGLTIVKTLIELMGGSIQVESEVNKGSTFVCTIPFLIGNEQQMERVEAINADNTTGTGHTILLAEDNKNNQLLASKLLTMHGFTVDVAENGLIAVQKSLKQQYSLILMDIQMPEMDGLEAFKQIRTKSVYNANVPIVALTAHALKEEERQFRSLGFNDYVHKPIKQKALLSVIAAQLKLSVKKEETTESVKKASISTVANLDMLYEMFGDDKSAVKEMLQIFVEDVPAYIRTINEALKKDDWEKIAKTAHTLKSTFGFTGREDMVDMAEKLQHQKTKPKDAATLDLLALFCAEGNKIVTFFEAKLEKNDF